MDTNYRIEKEPRYGLDKVIVGPGVCETIAPEAVAGVKELNVLQMLEGAYAAGKSEEALKAPRELTGTELAFAQMHLPEGYILRLVEGRRYGWEVLDEEGDVYVQGISATARGVVLELMEAARKRGVIEGRMGIQHELRVVLGVEDRLKAQREEMLDRFDGLHNKNR